MQIFQKLIKKIRKELMPPVAYGRCLGATIGEGNFMPDKKMWSTEPYLVTIGNHCQIVDGVRLLTHGGGNILRDIQPDFDAFGKIVIGDYVYIGTNSLVMPGVTLGDHTLVAAGSVVTKSYQGGVVLAGNPARVVCTIKEYYEKMKPYNIGTKGLCEKKKEMILKKLDERKFIKK